MARIPDLDEVEMDARQRRIYDEIVAGPRGEVVGPLRVWLRSPELADKAQQLGAFARYGSSLPPHLSELAILTTGAAWRADFEWWSHVGPAREAGISEEVLEAIRTGAEPPFADEASAAVYHAAVELHRDRRLSDETYTRAEAALGVRGVVDLVGILGYYTLISMTLNVFEIGTPDGARPFGT